MPGKGENKSQAGKDKEDMRDVVSGSGEAGRNSSTLGGSSSSHSQVQARPGGDALGPTILPPNSLELRSLTNNVGQTLGSGFHNKRGGPVRNVISATDELVPDSLSFQGTMETLYSAGLLVQASIGENETDQIAGFIFKARTDFISRNPRQPEKSGLTVVSGGSGVRVPREGKYIEMRETSEALAREQEEAADERVKPPKPEVKCGGCGSKTHELFNCLKTAPNGLMKGCPKCNTIEHDIDGCPKLTDINNRFRFLVTGRGHMPAFATKKMEFHWAAVFCEWRAKQDSLGRRRRRDPRLPWTPEFTLQQGEAKIQEYQRKLDEDGFTGARLPADPATRDWDSASKTYPTRLPRSQAQPVQAQQVQAQQIQAVRALAQDIIKDNPAARVPGAAAAAAVNKGPSTEVEIDDLLDEIFDEDEDSPAVEAGSTQGGTKDVQMEDAPAAEGTKPEETKSGETTDTEDGSGDEKSGGEEDGLEESDAGSNLGDDKVDWSLE
ncbi:uncharacterized protein NECHADRAFT_86220 [Fusarium vanettenii 77-13-4]|uniref:Zinc knuckle domain-containing protein n=1 Tax=Fusarium vanettenii (strain ATCC MYA-4622 / CBS 123669 / FGSC 9596 / NRRL 45880 / 77-13-4) TaxID=660122 RepID=C7ZKP0_FUSV7|nr:uncharacterized protein NECHADRAFT_86220 [Fusarium vanettenii 77-13-4]EEU35477.1 predicted protein [Fusarium vanettenii 77-13-4]